MAFVTNGLPNEGKTGHFFISYDEFMSPSDGVDRALGLLGKCEGDWALMSSWFPGVNLVFDYPVPVQLTAASGGASWENPSELQRFSDRSAPTISLSPGLGISVDVCRYLLASEFTEMLMRSQDGGWFSHPSLFQAGNEESKGEALSRFLGAQLMLVNGLSPVPPIGYLVSQVWLNSARDNFVDNDPGNKDNLFAVGCETLFLYYLLHVVGKDIPHIVAAGADNLGQVYRNLTGKSDGWTSFSNLIADRFPAAAAGFGKFTYSVPSDNLFPVPSMTDFFMPGSATVGFDTQGYVTLDRHAPAQVHVFVNSDDPGVAAVPGEVVIDPGASFGTVPVTVPPKPMPFITDPVPLHAVYAGHALTSTLIVRSPVVVSLILNPDVLVSGDSGTAVITLDHPSLIGDVEVQVDGGNPAWALVSSGVGTEPQSQIVVPVLQGSTTAEFTVTAQGAGLPHKDVFVAITATYLDSSHSAVLTVKSKIPPTILASLRVVPSKVTGGQTATGHLTLEEPLPVPTSVGVAALEPGIGPPLPLPGVLSDFAHTDRSEVPFERGATTGTFKVVTEHVPLGTTHAVVIEASATTTIRTSLLITP